MEKDDFTKEDFLRDLIQQSPLDSPSNDFVDRVMANIQMTPEVAEAKKPLYLYLQASMPYALISLLLIFVLATSDLPVFNWLPGKNYLVENLLPYMAILVTTMKNVFASKFVNFGLLIGFSAGILFLIDRIFSRRTSL